MGAANCLFKTYFYEPSNWSIIQIGPVFVFFILICFSYWTHIYLSKFRVWLVAVNVKIICRSYRKYNIDYGPTVFRDIYSYWSMYMMLRDVVFEWEPHHYCVVLYELRSIWAYETQMRINKIKMLMWNICFFLYRSLTDLTIDIEIWYLARYY